MSLLGQNIVKKTRDINKQQDGQPVESEKADVKADYSE